MRHPSEQLDDDVHQRVRLGILALLNNVSRADFAHLKSTLNTSDGNLRRHLRVLEDAGFVDITKVVDGRRPQTWVKITREGRTALRREIEALKEIVAIVEGESGRVRQTGHSLAHDSSTA